MSFSLLKLRMFLYCQVVPLPIFCQKNQMIFHNRLPLSGVLTKNLPSGLSILQHSETAYAGLGRCSSTSIQVTRLDDPFHKGSIWTSDMMKWAFFTRFFPTSMKLVEMSIPNTSPKSNSFWVKLPPSHPRSTMIDSSPISLTVQYVFLKRLMCHHRNSLLRV